MGQLNLDQVKIRKDRSSQVGAGQFNLGKVKSSQTCQVRNLLDQTILGPELFLDPKFSFNQNFVGAKFIFDANFYERVLL